MVSTVESLQQSLMNETDLADILGCTVKSLRNRRSLGEGPVHIRVTGRKVAYLVEDVEQWLMSRRAGAEIAQPISKQGPKARSKPLGGRNQSREKGQTTSR